MKKIVFCLDRNLAARCAARIHGRAGHLHWIMVALALSLGSRAPSPAQVRARRPPVPTAAERKSRLNKALLIAIKSENVDLVSYLLAKGADPNSADSTGRPALLLAFNTRKDIAEEIGATPAGKLMVRALLDAGANVNCKDAHGVTALMFVVKTMDTDLVKALLKHNPRLDDSDEEGNTALIIAATANEDVVRALLDGGANVNKANKKGVTPIASTIIAEAAWGAMAQAFKPTAPGILTLLQERGADLHVKMSGLTLLMVAAGFGNEDVAAFLVNHGLEVNATGDHGLTALLIAVFRNKARMVKWLLAHGADPNVTSEDGGTPLMVAAEHGSYAITERLLKSGARPNARRPDGITALMTAQRNMNTAIVNLLKQAGAQE